MVKWTSAGANTSVTWTDLTLVQGVNYFVGIKAKNGAGLSSAIGTSDGIIVDKNPPTIKALTPSDGSSAMEADVVPITVAASDPDGDPLQYQFSVDGVTRQSWSPTASWSWNTAAASFGWHTLRVEVKGAAQTAAQEFRLFILRRPPTV